MFWINSVLQITVQNRSCYGNLHILICRDENYHYKTDTKMIIKCSVFLLILIIDSIFVNKNQLGSPSAGVSFNCLIQARTADKQKAVTCLGSKLRCPRLFNTGHETLIIVKIPQCTYEVILHTSIAVNGVKYS